MNITINDINIYYEVHGDGKQKILILPGWGNTKNTFNYMINFLKDYATIYILDFPGFGNSSFPNRDLNIYDYGYLIKDFININNINDAIVIGHSFGCRVILILSGMLNMMFKKIIILNGAGIKRIRKISSYIKIISYKILKQLKWFMKKDKRKEYIRKLSKRFGSSDYNNLSDNMKKTFVNITSEDLSYLLPNVKPETLLIWGENDQDTPLSDGKLMRKKLDNAELIQLKNTGHFSYLENPVLINKIIYEFIKEDI